MTDGTTTEIEAAFRKLQILQENEWHLMPIIRTLSFIPRGETGTPPHKFSEVGRKAAQTEINSVSDAAETLKIAIDNLSQTSIVALANQGLLQIIHHRTLSDLLAKVFAVARQTNLDSVPETQGRGRPRNNLARGVASILASNYATLTGKNPTVSTRSNGAQDVPYGPFFDLVTDIFKVLEINASAEAAARAAVKEFKERNK